MRVCCPRMLLALGEGWFKLRVDLVEHSVDMWFGDRRGWVKACPFCGMPLDVEFEEGWE